jgi:hypothetical protein
VRSAANKSVNGITRANINSLLMLGAFSLLISSLVWQLKNSSASAAADSFLSFSLSYLALPCFGSDCSLSCTHTLTHTHTSSQTKTTAADKENLFLFIIRALVRFVYLFTFGLPLR